MLLLNSYFFKRVIAALEHRKKYRYSIELVRSFGVNKLRNALGINDFFSINESLESAVVCPYNIDIIYGHYNANLVNFVEPLMNNRHTIYGTTRSFNIADEKWNVDFKTDYRWPSGLYYLRYPIVNYPSHSDIKYPWEVSRCHHLLWLGQAFFVTKDELYAQKVVDEIEGWVKNNPFMRSVNWVCAMDVAIRAANWIHSLMLIKDSEAIKNKQFENAITNSLIEHTFYVEKNIEKGKPYSGNHYIADLAGLIQLYLLLDKRGDSLKNAVVEFQNEVRSQILPSGFHFEKSTSYHKLVAEMILHTYYQLREHGISVDEDVVGKIKAMPRFFCSIIQPDGNIPFISDNDNGCFLPYDYPTNHANGSGLIALAKIVFPEEDYGTINPSVFYADSNFAVLRNNNWFSTIHNNPISRYQSEDGKNNVYNSHTHCDMLSFTLSIGKQNVIVDPGTFCYTSNPDERLKFRSTKMHNTICVDGLDQQKQDFNRLFNLKQYSFPLKAYMSEENTFEGEYEYRNESSVAYKHYRRLQLSGDSCTIKDILTPIGKRKVMAYFHLSPDLGVNQSLDGVVVLHGKIEDYRIVFSSPTSSEMHISIEDGVVSPAYGEVKKASVIVVDLGENDEKVELVTEIKALSI